VVVPAVMVACVLPLAAVASVNDQSKKMTLLGSSPKPGVTNSDLAFRGSLVVAGNYSGLRLIDASDPKAPVVKSDFSCSGSQGDVSIWGNLVFRSIDRPQTTDKCAGSMDTPGVPGFEGIRIIDISDPTAPAFVKGVATDCGSHTHTLIPDLGKNRVLIYVSSYPLGVLGKTPYGTDCERFKKNGAQGHSKISVVAVPLNDPGSARVIAEPHFELKDLGGVPGVRGCHDIQVFLELKRAAAACMSEGQIWDISNPVKPVTLKRIDNPEINFWHGAAFTWDGKIVAFGDELFPSDCNANEPDTRGAVWFYDASNPSAPLGHFRIPRPQPGDECTVHNFNVIPVRNHYLLVTAAYGAGTSVVDFTNPAAPKEVAYYDPDQAFTWSSYWYNGLVYANDSPNGVQIYGLKVRNAKTDVRFDQMNPQTQEELLH
jgi:hypothetical protein